MSRRKPIDAKILEACKAFDAHIFAETIQGAFSDFPDYRRNQKRVLYPIWYLFFVILCGFFCGCNTIEEIAEYAQLQKEWFSSLLGKPVSAPSHGSLWWFLVKTSPSALKGCQATSEIDPFTTLRIDPPLKVSLMNTAA